MKKTQWHFSIWYFVLALLAGVWLQNWVARQDVAALSYDELKLLARAGRVSDLRISDKTVSGTLDIGHLKDLLPAPRIEELTRAPAKDHRFFTMRVEDPSLVKDLEASHVRFSGEAPSELSKTLLSWLLPALIVFALWSVLVKRLGAGAAGGVLELGKSKAKVFMERDVRVTFHDVAGVDEAKQELQEIVAFLRDPVSHGRLGARIPKGILLVGPPGTGKTLLARAVAGEAGVPFFSINGPEFVEMFVGVGAARVRDLFEKARQQAPAIIFIDELDALGRARGTFSLGGHDEKEQTLNQLLSEMDGFDPSSGLVLLAATNRPEILDPALLRAGRFDRQVLVDRPDREGRRQILALYLRKVKCLTELDPEALAALTPGFTGADLANLVNEAALAATRRGARGLELVDFHMAIERVVAGLEKRSRILRPEERRTVATHELGHAIVAMALAGTDPVEKISIIPRGIAGLGYTLQRPGDDRFLSSRRELEARLAVLLGGRAAERLILGDVSTGAADDIEKATAIARGMVTRFGMDDKIGTVSYGEAPGFLGLPQAPAAAAASPETTAAIDAAVHAFLEAAHQRALAIVKIHHVVLERFAKRLLEHETLEGADLTELRDAIAHGQPAALSANADAGAALLS